MTDYSHRSRWWLAAGALLLALLAGVVAYNIGVSHGLAQSAVVQGTAPPYGWGYRPWGFGFGFPILFVLFWILLFRGLFWGGPWRRHWCGPATPGKESHPADDPRGGR